MSPVVAVTGSASGIGAATRRRLEDEGRRVIGVDLRNAQVEADLSQPQGRRAAIEGVLELAGARLDGAVLCAGVGGHVADLGLLASVNYFGAVELLDALLPTLRRGERPAVVVIASNSAQFFPLDDHPYVMALLEGDEARARELAAKENGFIAYAGSKHALARAVRRRAAEWGKAGVRLNALAPGPVRTPLLQATADHPVFGKGLEQLEVPLGRFAEPAEIAALVSFLLGDEASYVHGSVVYVDGGNDASMRPDRF